MKVISVNVGKMFVSFDGNMGCITQTDSPTGYHTMDLYLDDDCKAALIAAVSLLIETEEQ